MTLEVPNWMQGGTYTAKLDRAVIAALYDEGVLDLTAMKVSQRGAGANFSVDVSVGNAIVTGDNESNQGNYLVQCTALENKTVTAAPGSNSRIDLVVLQINDPTAGGAAGNNAVFTVIAGSVSATPSAPATPASAIALATIGPITSGTVSITDSLITDVRPLAGRKTTPGVMELAGGTKVPNGWLTCDGAAVSRTTYAKLFAQIGTAYGVGNGSTTFNLPDMRGRVPVPKSLVSPFTTEGATGGSKDAVVVSHAHALAPTEGGAASGSAVGFTGSNTVRSVAAGSDYTGIRDLTGGISIAGTDLDGVSGTNANMPPYQVVGAMLIRT